jgi:hypothetical protein
VGDRTPVFDEDSSHLLCGCDGGEGQLEESKILTCRIAFLTVASMFAAF